MKTVKIKHAQPYYRSLKEHRWVSTKRAREVEGVGGRNHSGQSLTLTMCTEMKSLKLNPLHSSGFMTREWEMLLRCTCHSTLPSPGRAAAVKVWRFPLTQKETVYEDFSGLIRTAHFFLDHPPKSSRRLAQSKFSLPPSVPRIPPWAVGKVPTTC